MGATLIESNDTTAEESLNLDVIPADFTKNGRGQFTIKWRESPLYRNRKLVRKDFSDGHESTWQKYVSSLDKAEKDLLDGVAHYGNDDEELVNAIENPAEQLKVASDGGCNKGLGSFGWVIGSATELISKGFGAARGATMSS